MNGVEEGSGLPGSHALGMTLPWSRVEACSLSNRRHCSGQDFLLASIDTFPEGEVGCSHLF